MATLPTKVQPGDLITSEFINALIDVCIDLQQRVTKLESPVVTPAGLEISALLPSGTKRIGDALHIVGHGFDAPAGTIVTIDGIGVAPTPGADRDRELIVTIPNVQGVTEAGKNVTLVVSNAKGTDLQDFVVFPAVATIPSGQIFVRLTQPPSATQLQAGQSYTFGYSVQAITDLEETYTVTASVDAGWAAQIVDTSDNPLTPAEVSLPSVPPPAGATTTVRVRVSIPSGVPNGTTALMRVTVTSKRNPTKLVGRSGGESITVNAAPPGPVAVPIVLAEAARVTASQPVPSTAGGVVRIAPDVGRYRITFSAEIKAGTVYHVQIQPLSDPRWIASFSVTTTVTTQDIGPAPSDTNQPILVFLEANAGAPETDLVVTVTSTTDATKTGQVIQPIALL